MARLFYDAVHRVAAGHYSPEQLRAWVPAVPHDDVVTGWASDGRLLLVAVDEADRPVAFADLEPDGHIDHLFCRPDHAGTGVTGCLYAAIEAAACEQGIALLFVEASEPARRFFLRQGFRVEQRRDFVVRDVPIHNYRMTKTLGTARPEG